MSHGVQVTGEGPGGEVFLTPGVHFIREDSAGRIFVREARNVVRFDEDGKVFITMGALAILYGNPIAVAHIERRP